MTTLSPKKKLLWIGDACCDSGFARATHYTLTTLKDLFDVAVLGLNYLGDPHSYPYPIYPVWPGGDSFGIGRLEKIVPFVRPDVVVIQNDPWNIPFYMEMLQFAKKIPVVAILAVDGLNCRGGDINAAKDVTGRPLTLDELKVRGLNDLKLAIFWTEFGRREAVEGGCKVSTAVIPLGVDLSVYTPLDRKACRREVLGDEIPENAFLVGNVNRNQPRKRMDLTIAAFAEWIYRHRIRDAYLMLHVAPTGEDSFDLKQLVGYFDRIYPGVSKRVMLSNPGAFNGLLESTLAKLYNCFDVGITTSQSEGFGLPTLEMMACGVSSILPDHSAFSEWASGAAQMVPCSTMACTPNSVNVIGAVVEHEGLIQALHRKYMNRDLCVLESLAVAGDPRYDWGSIGVNVGMKILSTLWPNEYDSVETIVAEAVAR